MGIVRDLYYARKMSAGLKLPAPTVALLIKRLRLAAAMGGGIEKTVSGTMVHITDALAKAALSVLASIEPIQDLHGYSQPWPAGGGKNLADVRTDNATSSQRISVSGDEGDLTFETTGDFGRAGYTVPVVTGQTYTISFKASKTVSSNANSTLYVNDTAGNWNYSYGAVLISKAVSSEQEYTKTITATSDTLFLGFYISAADSYPDTVIVKDLQVELGSSKTSFSPYSNICPITGRTGLSVYRTGKNLYSRENSEYNVPVYGQNGSSAAYPDVAVWWIKVNPSTKYTISLGETPSSITFVRWINCDENKGFISRPGGTYTSLSLPLTITTPSGCYWVQIAVNEYPTGQISQNDWKLQIEESKTATSYEAFSGNLYSVDWTDEAGTVYGGTVDVVTGVLTVDRANIASYNGEVINEPWLSSMDEYAPGATPTTGAQVVYKLATPLTYQLTPQEVQMLLGENNVWASSGDTVSVTYYAEGNANPLQSLNILLGGNYSNPKTADDVSDKEALEIILGGNK